MTREPPKPEDWQALAQAAASVLAELASLNLPAAFRAVREVRAAAILLLFALAERLATSLSAPPAPVPLGYTRFRLPRLPTRTWGWRNPPASAPANPQPPPVAARRTSPTHGVNTARLYRDLKAIAQLCAWPHRFARRLALRLRATRTVITRAETRAHAVIARAEARDARAAAHAQKQSSRRRRRDSG